MKKIISTVTALSLCILSFLCTNIQVTSADSGDTGVLSVKPIITFEEDATVLQSYLMLNGNNFTGLHSGSNTTISGSKSYSGSSARVLFQTPDSYSEIQIDGISGENKPISNWTGAQYLQFWTKNTSSTPIVLDSITLKQFGYNSHLKRTGHAYQLKKGSSAWAELALISEKDNGNFGAVQIPGDFEGFIRISLNDFADGAYTFNADIAITGFSFWYFMTAGNNQLCYLDDIAIAGQLLATDEGSLAVTKTESEYFAAFQVKRNFKLRPVISFEETAETLTSYNMLNTDGSTFKGLNSGNNASISTAYNYSQTNSARINFPLGESYTEVQVDGLDAGNKPVTDWSGAEYLQFWVKNTSSIAITLDAITIKQHGYNSRFKSGTSFQKFASGTNFWESQTAITEKDNARLGAVSIPANFEGFIRLNLGDFSDNSTPYNNSVAMTGFSFWFYMGSGNNEPIYLDDIAVIGETLAADSESQTKTVTEASYLHTDVTGINLDKTSETILVGETLTINASIQPVTAFDKSVVWSTDNSSVVSVENGVVTALSAGSAVITATTNDGNFIASCAVTVNPLASFGSYVITDKEITGVAAGTTANAFIEEIEVSLNVQATLADVNHNPLSGNDYIGCGTVVTLSHGNYSASYTVLIYGDVNGDGILGTLDVIRLKKQLLNPETLDGILLKAGDFDRSGGELTIGDLLTLKSSVLAV